MGVRREEGIAEWPSPKYATVDVRFTNNISVFYSVHGYNCCSPTKRECCFTMFHNFRWGGKRLHYFVTNLLILIALTVKFYQNRLGFAEDTTKNNLVCFFSVHGVVFVIKAALWDCNAGIALIIHQFHRV